MSERENQGINTARKKRRERFEAALRGSRLWARPHESCGSETTEGCSGS
jgi:hypothetical protein